MIRNCRHKKILWSVAGILLAVILGFSIYVSDAYQPTQQALEALDSDEEVSVTMQKDGSYVFSKREASVGLIFYPGGKVAYEAYAPLMHAYAKQGILCVLVKMPCNLAVLDQNAADGIAEQYPEIESWYIGGHSLGGSMAASYAAAHAEELDGVILLAAYSTKDLTDTGLKVLSIYGSEDKVLNMEKYKQYQSNLPSDVAEFVIDGGCHAYFGDYGAQKGDGEPAISPMEQIGQTAELTQGFIYD